MERKVKLLNTDLTSYGKCQWVVGEWKETNGEGHLCGSGWLHCYDSAELAVLLNPIHAQIANPVGYVVEVAGEKKYDYGLKRGYTRMRLVEPIILPLATTEHYVRFGIVCALHVYHAPQFVRWAHEWLTGVDRTVTAAEATMLEAKRAQAAAEKAWIRADGADMALAEEYGAALTARTAAEAATWANETEAADAATVAATAVQWAARTHPRRLPLQSYAAWALSDASYEDVIHNQEA